MIIYKAVNIINGKSYIGQTVQLLNKRKSKHFYDSKKISNLIFHNAIRKHGWNNFTWAVLCECETKEELDEMEFHYIKQYNSHKSDKGYNMTWGGDGGFDHINNNKGINHPRYGKTHTKQSRYKISKNHVDVSGKNNPRSKKWKLISPNNEEYIVEGVLKVFCIDHDISIGILKRNINKKITIYNSTQGNNTIGWSLFETF